MPEKELCAILRKFYGELATKEGEEYSRSSILPMLAAIQRHITGAPFNCFIIVVSGPQFRPANDIIQGKLKKMKREGLDFSHHYPAIPQEDINKMYSTNTLSEDNPTALQLKVYFELGLHFGRRGREGLRDLQKSQIVFKIGEVGNELKLHKIPISWRKITRIRIMNMIKGFMPLVGTLSSTFFAQVCHSPSSDV